MCRVFRGEVDRRLARSGVDLSDDIQVFLAAKHVSLHCIDKLLGNGVTTEPERFYIGSCELDLSPSQYRQLDRGERQGQQLPSLMRLCISLRTKDKRHYHRCHIAHYHYYCPIPGRTGEGPGARLAQASPRPLPLPGWADHCDRGDAAGANLPSDRGRPHRDLLPLP